MKEENTLELQGDELGDEADETDKEKIKIFTDKY